MMSDAKMQISGNKNTLPLPQKKPKSLDWV
jgi:hypothetical protein